MTKNELQKEIPKQYSEGDSSCFKFNAGARRTSSIFVLQEQIIETRECECDKCRLCGEQRETVHYLPSGYEKLVDTEYFKRRNNTLKLLAVNWAVEIGLLPEDTKWYTTNWERRKLIEKDGKKLFSNWEHPMKTDCIARR